MNAVTYATKSLEGAFGLLTSVVEGIDDPQYNFLPPGTCTSPSKNHLHAVSAVDFFINALVAGGAPSWGEFAKAHGLPGNPIEIWSFNGTIPVAAAREFEARVLPKALENVAKLSDSDLDTEKETQFFGKKTLADLIQLATWHTAGHAGDISAVKGVQGLKGLPF